MHSAPTALLPIYLFIRINSRFILATRSRYNEININSSTTDISGAKTTRQIPHYSTLSRHLFTHPIMKSCILLFALTLSALYTWGSGAAISPVTKFASRTDRLESTTARITNEALKKYYEMLIKRKLTEAEMEQYIEEMMAKMIQETHWGAK